MRIHTISLLVTIFACTTMAWTAPYVGYVYPAGGQQGTVIRVEIGGQRINGVKGINITGTGVKATFVSYEGANGPLNFRQQDLLKQRIQELTAKYRSNGKQTAAQPANTTTNPPATPETQPAKPKVTLPDLPDLRDLEKKTPAELRKIAQKYLNRQKRTKPPIAETVTLEITIAADATPGDRELRLVAPGGLSNPLVFQVSQQPEILEKNRRDEDAVAPPPVDAPVVVNGQIMPGEVDRFALKLKGGQRLMFTAQARHLIPYMADAVPGWMQTVLALHDANGTEVAFADDNSFDPDPSFCYQVPQDGDYTLVVRDAIYRGREDFVYRVIIRPEVPGETPLPFASLGKVPQDGSFADVNPLLPWVDSRIPQRDEAEPNTTMAAAQKLALPQLVRGRIGQPGDVDVYQFTGKAGDTVVAEVYARRLGSSMDALLRLTDAAGRVIAWNDDYKFEEMGLITHQADAYLSAKLPANGVYYVQVTDTQRHGGGDCNYYLRLGPPQGDFALRITPSTLHVAMGGTTSFTVVAFRKDGWNGDIELSLVTAPAGFALKDALIPAGKDSATVTLVGPQQRRNDPIILHIEGRAQMNGMVVSRPVVPAEKKMQAFASYHLVPAQQLMVMVTRR